MKIFLDIKTLVLSFKRWRRYIKYCIKGMYWIYKLHWNLKLLHFLRIIDVWIIFKWIVIINLAGRRTCNDVVSWRLQWTARFYAPLWWRAASWGLYHRSTYEPFAWYEPWLEICVTLESYLGGKLLCVHGKEGGREKGKRRGRNEQ